ncbi:formyltransferase family protein [Kangiella marina]|uniref:Formyl transferase N-terminal domain-containing protein n=1 Tax=Kangiella marina TaxID=1079178 RepID=A0ABP8INX1_9GAMM
MKVTLLCSDLNHPVYQYLSAWKNANKDNYSISIVSKVSEINEPGDILFLISCSEIVKVQIRDMFSHTLVLHASDLPQGRGWSPHTWDVLSGKDELTLSLINAEDSVDTGDIWKKKHIKLKGSELYYEINTLLFEAEIELISWACKNVFTVEPTPQEDGETSYYRKRTPNDSEVDVNKSIKEQFNLLRVCDPNRYPAFFELNGQKYKLFIEKYDEN